MGVFEFVLAASPIAFVLVGILAFKKPAMKVAPLALIWTLVLAFTYFNVTGLTFKENVAAYDALLQDLQPVLAQEPTGKTVAFFYITTAGAVNVRKSGDYIAKAIRMAGGDYVSFDESGEENALSTMTIQMESFYDAAADADVLIYNSTIDGELDSLDALLAKSPLLADFKAVQTGNVWCITKNFYQESLALGDLILDVHAVLNDKDAGDLRFLRKLS